MQVIASHCCIGYLPLGVVLTGDVKLSYGRHHQHGSDIALEKLKYNIVDLDDKLSFRDHTTDKTNKAYEVSIHRASPVWFVHWLAIHRASPVPIYAIWLYTGLDRTYYSFVFL